MDSFVETPAVVIDRPDDGLLVELKADLDVHNGESNNTIMQTAKYKPVNSTMALLIGRVDRGTVGFQAIFERITVVCERKDMHNVELGDSIRSFVARCAVYQTPVTNDTLDFYAVEIRMRKEGDKIVLEPDNSMATLERYQQRTNRNPLLTRLTVRQLMQLLGMAPSTNAVDDKVYGDNLKKELVDAKQSEAAPTSPVESVTPIKRAKRGRPRKAASTKKADKQTKAINKKIMADVKKEKTRDSVARSSNLVGGEEKAGEGDIVEGELTMQVSDAFDTAMTPPKKKPAQRKPRASRHSITRFGRPKLFALDQVTVGSFSLKCDSDIKTANLTLDFVANTIAYNFEADYGPLAIDPSLGAKLVDRADRRVMLVKGQYVAYARLHCTITMPFNQIATIYIDEAALIFEVDNQPRQSCLFDAVVSGFPSGSVQLPCITRDTCDLDVTGGGIGESRWHKLSVGNPGDVRRVLCAFDAARFGSLFSSAVPPGVLIQLERFEEEADKLPHNHPDCQGRSMISRSG